MTRYYFFSGPIFSTCSATNSHPEFSPISYGPAWAYEWWSTGSNSGVYLEFCFRSVSISAAWISGCLVRVGHPPGHNPQGGDTEGWATQQKHHPQLSSNDSQRLRFPKARLIYLGRYSRRGNRRIVIGFPIINLKQSGDRPTFIMRIPTLIRQRLFLVNRGLGFSYCMITLWRVTRKLFSYHTDTFPSRANNLISVRLSMPFIK